MLDPSNPELMLLWGSQPRSIPPSLFQLPLLLEPHYRPARIKGSAVEEELPGLEGEEEGRGVSELLCPRGEGSRGEHQRILNLSYELVRNFLTQELLTVLVSTICIDVELPHQLQHLVHGAAGAGGNGKLWER